MNQGSGPRRTAEILDATLRLLAERGFEKLTIEGVAERSGVNKTTIYRWWPSKAALLGAALIDAPMLRFPVPDTGSLHGDLAALARSLSRLLTEPPTAPLIAAALGAATHNAELASYTKAFFADRLAGELPIFERAAARGDLPDGADPMLIMDALAGAVWVRVLLRQLPIEPGFAENLATLVHPAAR
ncbi:TetR family transcriptional regulator [Actinoplanes ianthinogenes]|uniref:TetR family transcriptional regulator n=1 Tax=Actinoplanes ianthinogenes TaxID=122358 RepID=A0ABM7LJP6_9ACTN|nr:TetR/AcrR family transcriptional regulator [Actinoplanes ianthinogenes]BCJ39472.1 TetR family transcriptional regulator [Actinoplanes ianthinogenes]GGR35851.1 TetR family transcriptional regulator [Actinoplanes ianthinogenes]